MQREYHHWYSSRLSRDMELLVHGHAGAPILVFPTSKGRFFEYEDGGMVDALREMVTNGWFQLYCVDSVDAESFYNREIHPASRILRHLQYEDYLLNEVLPLIRSKNNHSFLISHGCSFGAYHALNIALRHPQIFGRVLAFSGKYDMTSFFDGYYDDNIYFNTPSHFVPNLTDPSLLEAIRRVDIIMTIGKTDPNIENNRALSAALWGKDIWPAYHEWAGWSHDWPYWQQMIRLYVQGYD